MLTIMQQPNMSTPLFADQDTLQLMITAQQEIAKAINDMTYVELMRTKQAVLAIPTTSEPRLTGINPKRSNNGSVRVIGKFVPQKQERLIDRNQVDREAINGLKSICLMENMLESYVYHPEYDIDDVSGRMLDLLGNYTYEFIEAVSNWTLDGALLMAIVDTLEVKISEPCRVLLTAVVDKQSALLNVTYDLQDNT